MATHEQDDEDDYVEVDNPLRDAINAYCEEEDRKSRDEVLARAATGDAQAIRDATQWAVNNLDIPFSIDPMSHHLKSVLDRLYEAVNEGKASDVKAALAPFKRPKGSAGRPPALSESQTFLRAVQAAIAADLLIENGAVKNITEAVAALAVALGLGDRHVSRIIQPHWPVKAQMRTWSFESLFEIRQKMLAVLDEQPLVYSAQLRQFLRNR